MRLEVQMKRLLSIIGGLLGLLALGALAVALALTFGGLRRDVKPVFQAFQSPIETPTQPPYPPPATPTRPPIPTIPPTVTRAPKPLPSPTPIPTATPVPTPLPLPLSAFWALWAENYPEGEGSILWLADPRDIGNRKEVLRFERDAIAEAALSPSGRKLALVTTYWKTATLWVANVDGTNLQQLDQSIPLGIRNLFWSRDSRVLAYNGVVAGETTVLNKAGTPVVEPTLLWTIDLLDPATGHKQHLVQANANEDLSVIGWSADGRALYYLRSMPQYGLWTIVPSSGESHVIVTLGNEPVLPILSPDGSKFLISTPERLVWISADGQERGDMPITHPGWGYQVVWSINAGKVIVSQMDEHQLIVHVNVIDLLTRESRNLGDFRPSPSGYGLRVLGISPDHHWLAISESIGPYFAHLPTGTTIPVSSQNRGIVFVAWVPRMPISQ